MKPLNRRVGSGRIQSLIPPAYFVSTFITIVILGRSVTAFSATNIVTSLADNVAGSFRQTIADSMPADSIVFDVSGTITLTNGELGIFKDITVIGPGASALAISGAGATRIFNINSNINVSISGLTLCNGRTPDGVAGTVTNDGGNSAPGGAVFTVGSLTLMNCVITANQTGKGGDGFSPPIPPYPPHTPPTSGGSSGNGGAIYNSGTLCVSNCVIADNATGRGGARAHNDTYWSGSGTAGSGGGIYNVGTLILYNSVVSSCTTGTADWSGAPGGGIWNGGSCFATHCIISNNATAGGSSQGGDGGGVFSKGLLALTNCTVSGNWCGNGGSPSDCFPPGAGCGGGSGGAGGGIFTANCVLIGCTITGNRAGGGGMGGFSYVPPYSGGQGGNGGNGGGVHMGGMFAFLTNCTIVGNFCGAGGDGGFAMAGIQGMGGNGGHGGGIVGPALTQAVVACTIVANTVGGGGGGSAVGAVGFGGGVYTWDAYGSAGRPGGFLNNLIAMNNGPDLYGAFRSLGCNLIGITNGCSGFTAPGDLVGSSVSALDPRIAPLADNGAPTLSVALLPGSPAIEAGSLVGGPATDQRGVARPQGAVTDIGAYEFEFTPQIISAKFQPPSAFWLNFCGSPNHNYALQTSTNLLDWSNLTNFCTGANGLCEFTCPDAGDSNKRFFRTKALASP
ncbi:MAG: hypothetical protein IH623_02680 [Verrucomicrobia bacterium]|nr:hypothetical protein [Verrucomicrobiota bacterium]